MTTWVMDKVKTIGAFLLFAIPITLVLIGAFAVADWLGWLD